MNQAVKDGYLLHAEPSAVDGIVVASTSLEELFRSDRIVASDGSLVFGNLNLPEYQRPYRWGGKQLERMLQDLRVFFPKDAGQQSAHSHDFYLGSIILHQVGGSDRRRGQLNIIDGQQRLTSMALLRFLQSSGKSAIDLQFSSPESQNRIRRNLAWLEAQDLPLVDFNRVNISLVVTRSEDDAYRFFETQNTSGVRLGGADIIKAFHLRSVPRAGQDAYARTWESLEELTPLVATLMKSRYWQKLKWRNVASDREPIAEREQIVEELAERTRADGRDVAYRPAQINHDGDGESWQAIKPGYGIRQPLSTGANAIRYVHHFHELQDRLLIKRDMPELASFYRYYDQLVVNAQGSMFLGRLYDCALLLYVNQFGTFQLLEASVWLFRTVFSLRLINEVSVREMGVQKFVRENPVLDWIASSFNHEQLMQYLRDYQYEFSDVGVQRNSIKSRFIKSVATTLKLHLPWEDMKEMTTDYDRQLRAALESFRPADESVRGDRR